ncbi:hypothetical protein F5B19DRAFT_441746 [Rostrohypoxylon terebratum]|nr:hypothetical protein F5B19DRAFT_441746 [Rostrohypoxylon terebratum]
MTQHQPATFLSLPTELRWGIWGHVLHQESAEQKKVNLFDSLFRSMDSMKQLISPLLAINRESREIAKAFYSFAIAVYRVTIPITARIFCSVHRNRSQFPLGQPAGVLRVDLSRMVLLKGPLIATYGSFNEINPAGCNTLLDFKTKQTSRKHLRRTQHVRIIELHKFKCRSAHRHFEPEPPRQTLHPLTYSDTENFWLFSRATEWFSVDPRSGLDDNDPKTYGILSIKMVIEVDGKIAFELPLKNGCSKHITDLALYEKKRNEIIIKKNVECPEYDHGLYFFYTSSSGETDYSGGEDTNYSGSPWEE